MPSSMSIALDFRLLLSSLTPIHPFCSSRPLDCLGLHTQGAGHICAVIFARSLRLGSLLTHQRWAMMPVLPVFSESSLADSYVDAVCL
jgi:hypothetical protein